MDIQALKKEWAGFTFEALDYEVGAEELVGFAVACGETAPRFVDADHADFEAVPSFTTKFHGRRMFPEGFPTLSKKNPPFDAGKCVEVIAPIRPGDRLTARSSIHDIYAKTGRSGTMCFIVHRMAFENQDGAPVAIVDWRLMQRLDNE